MIKNTYKPLVPRTPTFQKFYCRYCGMGYTKRIGMGKPPGNMGPCYYQAPNGERMKRNFHEWRYGEKF